MKINHRKKKRMNTYSNVKIHREVSGKEVSDYIEYNNEKISIDCPLYYIDGTVILKGDNDIFFVATLNYDYMNANIMGPIDFRTCIDEYKKINRLFDVDVRFENDIRNIRILISRGFNIYRMKIVVDNYKTFLNTSKYETYLRDIFRKEHGYDTRFERHKSVDIFPTPYGTSISHRFEIKRV